MQSFSVSEDVILKHDTATNPGDKLTLDDLYIRVIEGLLCTSAIQFVVHTFSLCKYPMLLKKTKTARWMIL